MSANLDMTNNRANIAFLGSRNDVWHRMGQEYMEGKSVQEWIDAAGLNFNVIKVPAVANLGACPEFDHIPAEKRFVRVEDRSFLARSDNGSILGYVSGENNSDGYKIVQPQEVVEWLQRYFSVDSRFKLDVLGSLDGGKRIWGTALFCDPVDVAGENHSARVLMSTTFDGSGSTVNQATMTRVVCQNTLRVAHGDTRAMVKTRHSARFDAEKVGKELSQLAQGFKNYKAIGDAMGQVEMAKDQVADFFKDMLEIPRTAAKDDISSRKLNMYSDLSRAYQTSVTEGAKKDSVWAALQAITRYADHDRTAKGGNGQAGIARFNSAQFGSGDAFKGKAMAMLLPLVKDKVELAA